MSLVIIVVASAILWRLWSEVSALRARVTMLEFAAPSMGASLSPWSAPLDHAPEPFVEQGVVSAPVEEPIEPFLAEPIQDQPPAPEYQKDVRAEGGGFGFEDIFGRRLPIWAGGVTLAVAGFLIVKYSIDAGLLSPIVRVVMGLIFGTVLIGAAEAALHGDIVVRDPRVRQALSGAGVATFYAAILVAANVYHLVGPGTAFFGMAIVTALAGGLSIRFGAPSAVLGLLGGLAAPALVGSGTHDVPLLASYLALAVGGLCALARNQRWWWLGATALAGGFGWGALLILGSALDLSAALSIGLYTLLLGVGLPLLLLGERQHLVRLVGSVAGCAQMAALVAVGGFAPLHWALYGLISIAIVWLSRQDAMLTDVPALGLAVALLLGAAWPAPNPIALAAMLAATAAIYGGPAAFRIWRSDHRIIDAGQLAAIAAAIGLLPLYHFPHIDRAVLALTPLLGAILAGGIAALGWRVPARREDMRFATLAIAATALVALAAWLGLPGWTRPPVIALLALGLIMLGERADDARIARGACVFGAASVALLLMASVEIERAVGLGVDADWTALVRWLVPASVAAAFAWRSEPKLVAQPIAIVLGYAATAQVVDAAWLPLVPALLLAGLAIARRASLLPGITAAAVVTLAWATAPLAAWLIAGADALAGQPLYVSALPDVFDAVLRLALPAAAFGTVAIGVPLPRRAGNAVLAMIMVLATVAAHIAYKQLFAIDGTHAFIMNGMAERTVWEVLLAAVACGLWRIDMRQPATALGAAGLAHFVWFTLLLHDPLWSVQAVGPWLAPAYATAFALVWASNRAVLSIGRARGWAMMALIASFAFSALRQIAHGPLLLSQGASEAEDIARSVLALALAGGFLWFGIARPARDWRVASLGLMLVAVGKVFLFDAAGLDGLLRIASFAALGFSLIGVGWLYSRYLPDASR